MTDDLRKRAAQQATYGNYWAGTCVGLIDEIERLRWAVAEALDGRWKERDAEIEQLRGQLEDVRWIANDRLAEIERLRKEVEEWARRFYEHEAELLKLQDLVDDGYDWSYSTDAGQQQSE